MSGNAAEAAGVVHYRLDAGRSSFTVQAFAEGLLSSFGHDPVIAIRDFAGEVEFVPGTLERARVRLTVRADSLAATDEVKEKDRREVDRQMRAEALEVSKYPEVVFESTSVTTSRVREGLYRARVIGNLTLHGVTQPNLWIQAEVTFREEDLRARGDFSLRQTDYKIKPVTAVGGMIKVKNELKFRFDIVAEKQR
ncbi:MAG: YceI family protein [Acidobacteria bacterium]|nr:YceI family protein [Acidobacteriota bacterium]